MNNPEIDFVVTWVDTNDSEWRNQYNELRGVKKEDTGRYRNWDMFKYWFRAVELFAPWVNKVFLVTNGKNPDWIDRNHPKLVLISHKDYIPEKYLPTFNSITIELNIDKIPGLSEHFVYFNDDCYINGPVESEYYFKNGLPCDSCEELLRFNPSYDSVLHFSTKLQVYTDMAILNSHFNRLDVIRANKRNWSWKHLSRQGIITKYILRRSQYFQFFKWRHFEQPMLKSVIKEIWEKEPYWMDKSCTQFRENISLNPYIIRYWQFATNRFSPTKLRHAENLNIGGNDIDLIISKMGSPEIKSLCINDGPLCPDNEFEIFKEKISDKFESLFPAKSSFEL